MSLITAVYQGASRNSFNDGVAAFLLSSPELVKLATYMRIPLSRIPVAIAPEKMFVFGAIAGGAKGAACYLYEGFDRHTMKLQRHHETIFKLVTLGIAFFAAYKTTTLLAQRFNLPPALNRSVLVIEFFDLMHQLFFYETVKRSN